MLPAAFLVPPASQCRLNIARNEHGAAASVRELPASAFTPEETWQAFSATLPEGFELVPTPSAELQTNLGKVLKNNVRRDAFWTSNLYGLKMSPSHRVLFGRCLRFAGAAQAPRSKKRKRTEDSGGAPRCPTDADIEQWRYVELPFLAYSIRFHVLQLDKPGVEFWPLFVPAKTPGDRNAWARCATDEAAPNNKVPQAPPGAFLPFARLPRETSMKFLKHELQSKTAHHPVMERRRLFEPLTSHDTATYAGLYQDGGVGYMLYRQSSLAGLYPEVGVDTGGQLVTLYARVAFSELSLAPCDAQMACIQAALDFALHNAPYCNGSPLVTLHGKLPVRTFTSSAEDLEANLLHMNVVSLKQLATIILARHASDELHTDAWGIATQWFAVHAQLLAMGGLPDEAGCAALPETLDVLVGTAEAADAIPSSGTVVFEEIADGASALLTMRYKRADYVRIFKQCELALKIAQQHLPRYAASMLLHDIAPPDTARFGARDILIVGIPLAVKTFMQNDTVPEQESAFVKQLNDLVTRFMYDMMIFAHDLLVQPPREDCVLSMHLEKAPGAINVELAKSGVAKHVSGNKPRKQREPHPALGEGFEVEFVETAAPKRTLPFIEAAPLTREQVDGNLYIREILAGPLLPSRVPGTHFSLYEPDTKCRMSRFSGTGHSWVVIGALVWKMIHEPRGKDNAVGLFDAAELTEDVASSVVNLLWAPFFNVVYNQVWKRLGVWDTPSAQRRFWKKAYAVQVPVLHCAMFWQYYPAFAEEWQTPAVIDIWRLKQAAEAEIHFMSRYGRVIRMLLNKGKRKLRSDFTMVLRNYVANVRREQAPNAPISRLLLSAFIAFGNNLEFGERAEKVSSVTPPTVDDEKLQAATGLSMLQDNLLFSDEIYSGHDFVGGGDGDGDGGGGLAATKEDAFGILGSAQTVCTLSTMVWREFEAFRTCAGTNPRTASV